MGNANTERKKRQRDRRRARQAKTPEDIYAENLMHMLDAKLACPETNCDGDCDNCTALGDDSLYECGDH